MNDLRHFNQDEVAELIGVTSRTLRNWEKEDDPPPRNADGSYDAAVFVQWFLSSRRLDASHERARKDKEMADKLALENRYRRGEVVEADDVERVWASSVSAARSRLIQLPDAIGQFCDAKYAPIITAEARKRVHEALAELAEGGFEGMGSAAN